MFGKFLYFILFLLAYGAWLAASAQMLKAATARERRIGRLMLWDAATTAAILAMLWPLTRRFDFGALLLLVVVGLGSMLMNELVIRLIQDPESYRAHRRWLNETLNLKSPRTVPTLIVIAGLAALVFPFVVGVLYVFSAVPSQGFSVLSVRLVLLFFFGAGVMLRSYVAAVGLAWDSLAPTARDVMLIQELIGLAPMAVWLSIMVRVGDDTGARSIGVAIIFLYATFAVLLPYAVGRRRAATLQVELLERRLEQLQQLRLGLADPMVPSARQAFLEGTASALAADARNQHEDHPDVELAVAITRNDDMVAVDLMTPDTDPFVPARAGNVKPQFAPVVERYEALKEAYPLVEGDLIRVDYVAATLIDRERVDRMLAALGVERTPTGDENALSPAVSPSESTSTRLARLGSTSSSIEPVTAPTPATPATAERELYPMFAPVLGADIEQVDRHLAKARSTRAHTFVPVGLGVVGTTIISWCSDALGSAVIDLATRSLSA